MNWSPIPAADPQLWDRVGFTRTPGNPNVANKQWLLNPQRLAAMVDLALESVPRERWDEARAPVTNAALAKLNRLSPHQEQWGEALFDERLELSGRALAMISRQAAEQGSITAESLKSAARRLKLR